MERRRLQLYAGLLACDLLALMAAFVVAGGLYRNIWPLPFAVSMAYAFVPIYAIIALYQRCYSLKALDTLRFAVSRMGQALIVSTVLCTVMIFYSKSASDFSRVMLSLAIVFGFLFMASVRVAMHRLLRWSYGPSVTSTLVVLDGGPAVDIAGAQSIDTTGFDLEAVATDPASLDRIGKLMRGRDRVVVSCPVERRVYWAEIMRAAGVRGDVISEALQELGALALKRENGQSFLVVSTGPLSLYARATKRAMDLAFTIPALILLSPLFLVVALLIKLEDGGPVFFVQPRMGRGNCIFDMYKFRSMRVDKLDSAGNTSTSRADDRVTRIGKFIRMTSIDELPQLLNVLKSEMSIVGPRPHALGSQAEAKLFWEIDEKYWQRHSLKPGLTGLAQVRGHRGATEIEDHLVHRLDADLEYIRDWSILSDLKIIMATGRVLLHPNAY
ncbi:exopolysaccharide biosynthesis polyprenyl glycosylphosphotransferase [Qipengyuania sp. GH29]|nr:exopolysaccharide biosynthesis polyprenyl glycosylphosphotransferase [Qipengyuania sphaerica]